MSNLLSRFRADESGATAIEYGLIAALVSITIILAAIAIGGSIQGKWEFVQAETAK